MPFLQDVICDMQKWYVITWSQMFDRVLIMPLPFLVKMQAFSFQPKTLLKEVSFTGIFQGFWQLSRNTCLKEHFWIAASKETDVIKSAVQVYGSLYKRCGMTPNFLHQSKNIYQKNYLSESSVRLKWKMWVAQLS